MFAPSVDHIRIVNLPTRSDRRIEMLRQLKRVGLENDPRVEFFDAYRMTERNRFRGIGSHGNFLSHLAILEQAAARHASVMILEDDCDFAPEVSGYVVPDEADIVYGGYEFVGDPREHGAGVTGSHCTIFNQRSAALAARYLRGLLAPDYRPDAHAMTEPGFDPNRRPSIDGALVWFRRAHPELNVVFAMPKLAEQRSSASDCTPKLYDRIPWGREAVRLLRATFR